MMVKTIIEKWYKLLEFPFEFDGEFYSILNSYKIDENSDIKSYDKSCKDGKKNLLSALYFCESTANSLLEKGVPFEIIVETLKDIVICHREFHLVLHRNFIELHRNFIGASSSIATSSSPQLHLLQVTSFIFSR